MIYMTSSGPVEIPDIEIPSCAEGHNKVPMTLVNFSPDAWDHPTCADYWWSCPECGRWIKLTAGFSNRKAYPISGTLCVLQQGRNAPKSQKRKPRGEVVFLQGRR